MNDSGQSYLFSGNASFMEALYEAYLEDRESVSQKWQDYFDQVNSAEPDTPPDVPHAPIQRTIKRAVSQ
jgi:2-oxoglutarate dehydrogenase E1 component